MTISITWRNEAKYKDTVKRVKDFYYLPNYIVLLTGWSKVSGDDCWYTICPLCQPSETRVSKHKFWFTRVVCGCFNPKCKLNFRNGQRAYDVIGLHAVLNSMTNGQAVADLAKAMQ